MTTPNDNIGRIENRMVYTGGGWTPMRLLPDGAPEPYYPGDVVNGHAFTGSTWVPVPPHEMPRPISPASQKAQREDRRLFIGLGALLAVVLVAAVIASVKGRGPSLPSDEKALLDAVSEGQKAVNSGNGVMLDEARKTRADAICNALPGTLSITGWVGKIESIDSTMGEAAVSIAISSDVAVRTWNNVLSDSSDHTLIKKSSPLWASISTLREGDKVQFDGTFLQSDQDCIDEMSVTQHGSMSTPDFAMKFSEIQKAN